MVGIKEGTPVAAPFHNQSEQGARIKAISDAKSPQVKTDSFQKKVLPTIEEQTVNSEDGKNQ